MAPATFSSRIAPAVLLTVLSPVVAEFLLGDFSIRSLPLVLALLPLYGCGALLIREVTRRAGRGWPTIVLLAVAYALLEEGFLTQSLFNPDYVGQRLLDYGYIPALGTSLNWSLFVLSIHVVWSIATPILIAEGVAADRTHPWLETPGLAITGLVFVAGCVLTASYSLSSSPFVATRSQFLVAGLLVLAAVVAACAIAPPVGTGERHTAGAGSTPPRPAAVFLATATLAILFMMAESSARGRGLAPAVSLLARVALEAVAVTVIVRWSRMRGWGPRHYLALSAGTTLTYGLFGMLAFVQGHTHLGVPTDGIDIAGQVVLTCAVLLLIWWGGWRSSRPVGAS